MPNNLTYRSIFVSDIHLGLSEWQPALLNRFLKNNRAAQVYLVGDIIDVWRLRRTWFWPESHNKLVRRFMKMSEACRVVYIPGNHDAVFREFLGLSLGGIEIAGEVVHETADGRRLLVCHGDQFDSMMSRSSLRLAKWGAMGYDALFKLNQWVVGIRSTMGYKSYWSLSSYVKTKVKDVVRYVSDFEGVLVQYAKKKGVHGVVCGHIHSPNIREIDGIEYYNCGDFVESMTILVENFDGTLEIINFSDAPGCGDSDESDE